MGTALTIIALIIEALPAAIQGVDAAVKLVEAGSKILGKSADEGRMPTVEEVDSVRALRMDSYDDFYTDDPDETQA